MAKESQEPADLFRVLNEGDGGGLPGRDRAAVREAGPVVSGLEVSTRSSGFGLGSTAARDRASTPAAASRVARSVKGAVIEEGDCMAADVVVLAQPAPHTVDVWPGGLVGSGTGGGCRTGPTGYERVPRAHIESRVTEIGAGRELTIILGQHRTGTSAL